MQLNIKAIEKFKAGIVSTFSLSIERPMHINCIVRLQKLPIRNSKGHAPDLLDIIERFDYACLAVNLFAK